MTNRLYTEPLGLAELIERENVLGAAKDAVWSLYYDAKPIGGFASIKLSSVHDYLQERMKEVSALIAEGLRDEVKEAVR